MKKTAFLRPIALLLALVLVLGNIALPTLADSSTNVVIKLHYNRPDVEYADWSVWFWNLGQEGVDIPFEDVDGEKIATFEVDPNVTSVGFIVKLPGWAAKDVAEDQFIDVAAYTSGTVHVYVESGVKGYTVVLGDDVVSGIKLTGAVYKEETGIVVNMTYTIGDGQGQFVVKGPDGEVEMASVTANDKVYTLVPAQPLDLYSDYTLIYNEEEYEITMPNVYSTESFETAFTYEGNDLGATWTAEKTAFRLWAPTASAVSVNLYKSGTEGTDDLIESIEMKADVNGTWVAEKEGDLNGVYYTYSVTRDGATVEAVDPYARTTGVNGKRAMVIDLASTNPDGWENDKDPNADLNITDAVIYELHVRDLSIDSSSGIQNAGKFLGLVEGGTTNANGVATGLDHMVDLGITHLHILPFYDYGSVDESKLDTPQFNWGYDPVNFNVPEGSYSTDPYNGAVRVSELKQTVMGLHNAGISVVMDVVYNHVYSGDSFCFNMIVPGYFSRISDNGKYSNGSGCGNDTASERSMVKKYIVDSVKYWADEYHIDGFRFDLVGLIDTETINAVIEEVHKTHPNVIFYGEGWTMSTNVTKDGYTMTTQQNAKETPEFAFFNDSIRDALKGSVFDAGKPGFVSGASGQEAAIQRGFMAQVNWCPNPTQTINYASCHDNYTLYDKLVASASGASAEDLVKMNNLTAAIYMTAQGVPFIHAGEEMLRTKNGDHNSYSSSDEVNSIKWDTLNDEEYQNVYNYYKGLIAFRKAHPALRMTTAEDVAANVSAITGLDSNVTAFQIKGGANGDESKGMFFVFNANEESTTVTLPDGLWGIYVNGEKAGTTSLGTASGELTVAPISAMVLLLEDPDYVAPSTEATESVDGTEGNDSNTGTNEPDNAGPGWVGTVLAIVATAVVAAGAAILVMKKRQK